MWIRRVLAGAVLVACFASLVAERRTRRNGHPLADFVAAGNRMMFVISQFRVRGDTLVLESARRLPSGLTARPTNLESLNDRIVVVVRSADVAETIARATPEIAEFDGYTTESDFVYALLAPIKVDLERDDCSIIEVTDDGLVGKVESLPVIRRIVFRRDGSADALHM